MRKYLRLTAVLLVCGLLSLLTGCFGREQTGEGYLFTIALPGSPECLDPQFTENANAAAILPNMLEGLMRLDENGEPVPAEAEEYTISEDGLRYMFTLRQDCYWHGKDTDEDRPERVTSRDYVFAFQRLLDPAMRSPYAEDYSCIKNAVPIMAGIARPETLGVTAPDGNTVIFELEAPEPDFLLLLTRNCAVPCNEAFFESTKGRYGLDENTVLCNGAFYLTKWNYDRYSTGNFITMRKNALYYDKEAVAPSSLQFDILSSRSEAETAFAEGNADVLLTDTSPDYFLHGKNCTIQTNGVRTMGLIFNPDNTLLQNTDLRQALAYGIDRAALAEIVSGDVTPAYGAIPPAVTLLGRSYRELYADEPLSLPYDPTKATECFCDAAAVLRLGAMNTMQIMIPSNLVDTDAMLAVCQRWQDLFGYYIGIETVSPEEYDRRIAGGEYSIALYSFQPEQDGCYEALKGFADKSELLGLESETFTSLLNELDTVQQLSDTVELSGQAEQALLDTCCFIPLFYKNTYLVYTADNTDILCDPFSGTLYLREAKHFT